eukprot:348755_1
MSRFKMCISLIKRINRRTFTSNIYPIGNRNKISHKFKNPKMRSISFHIKRRYHSSLTSKLKLRNNSFTHSIYGIAFLFCTTLYITTNKTFKATAETIFYSQKHPYKTTNNCPEWDYNWDNREKSSNNSTVTFTLIRHGQYVHDKNPDNKILTDLGQKQAQITGIKLKSLCVQYDEIICSTIIRAVQTADIIINELYDAPKAKSIKIKYDCNLAEGCPAMIIPESKSLIESGFFDDIENESGKIKKAFETYIHRNDDENNKEILIIGHGNVFRYFICRVLQFPPEAWLRFAICNCGIIKFKIYSNGKVSVRCIGGDQHFEKEEITYN